jgi:hypothetical protein
MFQGWRDVLRILLAGFTHDVTTTDAAAWAKRDCNSAIRQALANSYGSMFENSCAASAGDGQGGNCTRIRHIFRRDDFSGTTDTVVALLNLPSIVSPETTVTQCTGVIPNVVCSSVLQHTGANPFCNAVRPGFVLPQSTTVQPPTCMTGSEATWDPTQKNPGLYCTVGGSQTCITAGATCNTTGVCTACPRENAVYRATMQDNDPIRRPCVGSGTGAAGTVAEDICSHSADVGLVLTMNDVPEKAPRTNTDRYNAHQCSVGHFVSVTAPEVYDGITQARQICARGLLCPNGDCCNNLGGCVAPADTTNNAQCMASKLTTPALATCNAPVPVINPKQPSLNDGRSYNQHLYAQVGNAGAYQTNGFTTPLPMTGAYHRIQAVHTLVASGAAAITCQLADMTNQIGCLVTASPCSIGYAGRQTLTTNPNAAPIKINKQSPDVLCIQNALVYPFSRKLYLNTLTGFGNVSGQELALAGCETDLAQPSLGTPANVVTTAIAGSGFVQIGPFVNAGKPFCEDFNELALCGAGSNNDACAATLTNLDNFPVFETVCGDGAVDAYEDCDNGTLNGPPPAACSKDCRNNF